MWVNQKKLKSAVMVTELMESKTLTFFFSNVLLVSGTQGSNLRERGEGTPAPGEVHGAHRVNRFPPEL